MNFNEAKLDRRQFLKLGCLSSVAVATGGLLVGCRGQETAEGEAIADNLVRLLSTKNSNIDYLGTLLRLNPGVQLRQYPSLGSRVVGQVESNSILESIGAVIVNEATVSGSDWNACFMIIHNKRMRYVFANDKTRDQVKYYDPASGFEQFNSVSFRSPANLPRSIVSVDQPITFRFGKGGEIDQYPSFRNKTSNQTSRFEGTDTLSTDSLNYKNKEDLLRELVR